MALSATYCTYHSVRGDGYLLLVDCAVRLLTLPGVGAATFWGMVASRLGLRRSEVIEAEDAAPAREVEEFLAGRRERLSFPIDPPGTDFQRAVWARLREIPYGATATYGEIAGKVGQPRGARVVGAACGRNPIALAIPCHRVVGAGGRLRGFGGGPAMKRELLDLEEEHRDKG